jgi:hypothetical protein
MISASEENQMRLLIALLLIAYLVGIGVTLAPTIKTNWSSAPVSQFVESIVEELPRALSWPATAYRGIAETPGGPDKSASPDKPGSAQQP